VYGTDLVAVSPPVSVTVRVAVYDPATLNTFVTEAAVDVLPSPNTHLYLSV
jgi:hypothetical protein